MAYAYIEAQLGAPWYSVVIAVRAGRQVAPNVPIIVRLSPLFHGICHIMCFVGRPPFSRDVYGSFVPGRAMVLACARRRLCFWSCLSSKIVRLFHLYTSMHIRYIFLTIDLWWLATALDFFSFRTHMRYPLLLYLFVFGVPTFAGMQERIETRPSAFARRRRFGCGLTCRRACAWRIAYHCFVCSTYRQPGRF